MSANLITTDELDFAQIKQNLKTFLSSQTELGDYDFEGSVISTLIDVLAYNTHYNALYTNFAVNEMFLDSASKRSSLVSISKLLGYTPKSVSSAKAIVDITVGTFDQFTNSLTLSPGTTFTTEINEKSYTFNIIEDISATKNSAATSFVFEDVELYEGESVDITYTKTSSTRFVIPESNVDMSTLRVSIYNPGNSTTSVFVSAKSLLDVAPTSKVFFTKQIESGLFEIFFGDGVFGVVVDNGSVITLTYLVSNGEEANGGSIFSYNGGADSTKFYIIETSFASSGGAPEESRESIRFFAPLSYQAQNRAVTANDYAAIVAEAYPNIETINVWGGQDNVPPQYGKVFIAAKPFGRNAFTAAEKLNLRQGIVAARGVITVTPEFVDPKYYDIEMVSNVYFDPTKTTRRAGEIGDDVRLVIEDYSSTLSKFEVAFRHSNITAKIDNTDNSIVSSISTIRVRVLLTTILGVESDYSYDFKNPIAQSNNSTFYSTRFFLVGYSDRGYIKNNGTDLEFYTENSAGVPTFRKSVGSINFNGSVTLQNLNITSLYDEELEFVFYPSSYDVVPPNGVIVRMPENRVTVNMIVDNLSQVKSARFEHIFSPSR
jgi:hypothetical protein